MTDKPKRQLILEAAFEVFSQKGFHGAKVEEIAKGAGIGKGTIYEYFTSKADVFHSMYLWYVEQYFDELETGLSEEKDPPLQLQLIVKNHVIFLKKIKSLAGKFMGESSTQLDLGDEFKNAIIDTYKDKLNSIKLIIEEGMGQGVFRQVDSKLITLFFFGSLNGISHSMFVFDVDMDNPDEVAKKVMDFLLNGIKSNGERQ